MEFINLDVLGVRKAFSLIKKGLYGKVDKIDGKVLSSNDFTDELKIKLLNLSNQIRVITPQGEIHIPTKLSDFVNDMGYVVYNDVINMIEQRIYLDDELSLNSSNAVKNYVITRRCKEIEDSIPIILLDYLTLEQLNVILASYVTTSDMSTTLLNYVTTSGLSTILFDYVTYEALQNVIEEFDTKQNVATVIQYTMLASNWSGKYYSFESIYPFSEYDLRIQRNGEVVNSLQIDAWDAAKIDGSPTANRAIAQGTVPTIDIPIILEVIPKNVDSS